MYCPHNKIFAFPVSKFRRDIHISYIFELYKMCVNPVFFAFSHIFYAISHSATEFNDSSAVASSAAAENGWSGSSSIDLLSVLAATSLPARENRTIDASDIAALLVCEEEFFPYTGQSAPFPVLETLTRTLDQNDIDQW